jgi:predicted  nucleic acid-binding Zn-ribbon protein
MQNQIPNLERYILAELQDMNAADTYIVSADIWVDCEQTHQVVHVLKKSDNTLVTTLFVETLTGTISATAPTGSITASACDSGVVSQFQVIDCSGAPLGTPVSVEQTIVLNKVLTSICNPEAIFQPIVDELHDHIEPLLEKLADAVQPYQPVDCAGANVGSPVDATNVKIVNATDIFCAIVTAIDTAKTAIVDAVNNASTDITTAIEASTAVLEEIKTELVTANTTLTNIKTDTASINTKLDTVITKIDTMITSLSSIDTKLTTTNTTLADILVELQGLSTDLADIKIAVESIDLKLDDVITSLTSIETKLDTLHTDLVGIKDTLDDILAQLDHELIITSPTVNCADDNGTKVSFYTREKIVWDSESGTEISKTVEYSLDGETFNTTKPAGTITIGACVTASNIGDSLVSYQVVDCDNNNVGSPIDSLPVMVVNKTTTSICNTTDITDPITTAINDKEEIDTTVDTIQVCGFNQADSTYAKYLIRTTKTINNKTGVVTEAVEYTTNGKDWTTTEPTDSNTNPILFTIGDCAPVQLPEPCYENKSYEIKANKALVFPANSLFKYGGSIYKGTGGVIEGNDIVLDYELQEGDSFGNGFDSMLKTLPNIVTVKVGNSSNAKLSVMQVCGTTPQEVNTVGGVIVVQAIPDYVTGDIDVSWNDVSDETAYDVYRYETVNGVTTAVKIGSTAANVTTFTDTTALPNTSYTYFVKGVNSISQVTSSTASVILNVATGTITLAWTGSGLDTNADFTMNAIYTP